MINALSNKKCEWIKGSILSLDIKHIGLLFLIMEREELSNRFWQFKRIYQFVIFNT